MVVVIVGIIIIGVLIYLFFRGRTQTSVLPPESNSRTLYTGEVGIIPVSLTVIEKKLIAEGCGKIAKGSACVYRYTSSSSKIEVFPHGPGFGPVSFQLSTSSIYSVQDIGGKPDPEIYKKGVRGEITLLGNSISLKEDSWKIIDMKYPWDAQY